MPTTPQGVGAVRGGVPFMKRINLAPTCWVAILSPLDPQGGDEGGNRHHGVDVIVKVRMEAQHRGSLSNASLSFDIRKISCQLSEGRLRGTDECHLEPIPYPLRGSTWPAVVVVEQDISDVVPVLLQTTAPRSVNLGEQVRRQRCNTKIVQVDLEIQGGSLNAARLEGALREAGFIPDGERVWRWRDQVAPAMVVKVEFLAHLEDARPLCREDPGRDHREERTPDFRRTRRPIGTLSKVARLATTNRVRHHVPPSDGWPPQPRDPPTR